MESSHHGRTWALLQGKARGIRGVVQPGTSATFYLASFALARPCAVKRPMGFCTSTCGNYTISAQLGSFKERGPRNQILLLRIHAEACQLAKPWMNWARSAGLWLLARLCNNPAICGELVLSGSAPLRGIRGLVQPGASAGFCRACDRKQT